MMLATVGFGSVTNAQWSAYLMARHSPGFLKCGRDRICGGDNAPVFSTSIDVRQLCVTGMSIRAAGSDTRSTHFRQAKVTKTIAALFSVPHAIRSRGRLGESLGELLLALPSSRHSFSCFGGIGDGHARRSFLSPRDNHKECTRSPSLSTQSLSLNRRQHRIRIDRIGPTWGWDRDSDATGCTIH